MSIATRHAQKKAESRSQHQGGNPRSSSATPVLSNITHKAEKMNPKHDSHEANRAFEGFEPANTTPVPDILFDKLLTELSGSELKVLLYIIRRTWGFKKTTDAISLTQLEKGIITREGKQLDKGCGLHRETICNALTSLEKNGYITSIKDKTPVGDDATTVYSIRFKKEVVGKSDQGGSRKIRPPVVGKNDHRSRNTRLPVVGKSDPQDTDSQQTDSQDTVVQGGVGETESPPQDTPPPEKPPSKNAFSELRSQWIAEYGPYGDAKWDNQALQWIAEQGGSFDDIKLLYPVVTEKRPEKVKNAWYKLNALKHPDPPGRKPSGQKPPLGGNQETNLLVLYQRQQEKRGRAQA